MLLFFFLNTTLIDILFDCDQNATSLGLWDCF